MQTMRVEFQHRHVSYEKRLVELDINVFAEKL